MAPAQFKVATIGYGLSAKVFHIPFIQANDRLKLHAVVQRKPTTVSNAASNLPGINVYTSADEMHADPVVDLVIICTPPWTHFELAKQAICNGKHTVIEKPMTPTAREADELVQLAARQGVILTVYQSVWSLSFARDPDIDHFADRRWDTDFLTACQLIQDGQLGSVVEFESHFDRFCPDIPQGSIGESKAGTGIIYDLGVHLIDQAYVLFGRPERVTAVADYLRDEQTQDTCTILLHYAKCLVTVKATTHSAEKDQLRFWVRGNRGSFRKCHLDIQESQLASGMQPTEDGFGVEPEERFGEPSPSAKVSLGALLIRTGVLTTPQGEVLVAAQYPNKVPELYSAFYDHLVQAMSSDCHGDHTPVKPQEARDVLQIVEAVLRSIESRTSVDLKT
ncbi:hypothetical protein LTR27_003278 [Elasticomyces elasticus]|nr:hypothetical protein LTR27_003278 [Elasticomyces elasticus]